MDGRHGNAGSIDCPVSRFTHTNRCRTRFHCHCQGNGGGRGGCDCGKWAGCMAKGANEASFWINTE